MGRGASVTAAFCGCERLPQPKPAIQLPMQPQTRLFALNCSLYSLGRTNFWESAITNLALRREATMKRHFAVFVLVLLMLAFCAPMVFAQAAGTVKGVCKDAQGNPFADAVVVYANQDNGQKYTLKTNKKGEYFSLGIAPGHYNVTLYKTPDDAKANKEVFHFNRFQVGLDESTLDFDLKKKAEGKAERQSLTPGQIKQ